MDKADNSIYGLLKQGHTLVEVARAKSVTRERVRQIARVMIDLKIIKPPADYNPREPDDTRRTQTTD